MNPLFPSADVCRLVDDFLTRALAESRARVKSGSVVPTFDRDIVCRQTRRRSISQQPSELNHVLAWTISQLETGLVHINHPRYFGLFNPIAHLPSAVR